MIPTVGRIQKFALFEVIDELCREDMGADDGIGGKIVDYPGQTWSRLGH